MSSKSKLKLLLKLLIQVGLVLYGYKQNKNAFYTKRSMLEISPFVSLLNGFKSKVSLSFIGVIMSY